MTEPEFTPPTDASRKQAISRLKERAEAADRSFEHREADEAEGLDRFADEFVRIGFPNGRGERTLIVSGYDIDRGDQIEFEKYRLIADYVTLLNSETGELEARLVRASGGNFPLSRPHALWRLPGAVVKYKRVAVDDEDASDTAPIEESAWREPTEWSVMIPHGDLSMEISRANKDFQTLWRQGNRFPTLKLRGFDTSTHDNCVELIEGVVKDLLFEIDMRYGPSLDVHRLGMRRRPVQSSAAVTEPPTYPRNEYAKVPLELYRHGRSAEGLPLLQYQYYYQAVEYFFPSFVRDSVIRQIRNEVQNPLFLVGSDESISRVINIAARSGPGAVREREQLRQAVAGCVPEADLDEWINELDELYDGHFTKRSQDIRGTTPVSRKSELAQQVSDRIYALRCRIVHAKEDGGQTSVEQLLPSSQEVAHLAPEIELVKRVAQRAIVSRSRPLT